MDFPEMRTASGKGKKSRSFTVRRLAYLKADALWEARKGKVSEVFPAWLCYLGSRAETQAFSANLKAGREALCGHHAFVVHPKAGYRWTTQEVPGGVVTCVYLPQLFHLEPVVEAEAVHFVFAPPRWWIREQARELRLEVPGEDPAELAQAALFAAFLDRRTTLPILRNLRFQLQLFRAARKASFTFDDNGGDLGFRAEGFRACGLVPPLAVAADPDILIKFLKTQIAQYKETHHGTTGIPASGRILPYPDAPVEQLRLDFAVA